MADSGSSQDEIDVNAEGVDGHDADDAEGGVGANEYQSVALNDDDDDDYEEAHNGQVSNGLPDAICNQVWTLVIWCDLAL